MPTHTYRIAVFASGNGSNAEKIFARFQHHPRIATVALLSGNAKAFALQRAANYGIEGRAFSRDEFKDAAVVLPWLEKKQVTHIVLAGFMWMIPAYLLEAFPAKIINIHPALLPRHGGKGMYGMHVHNAVKQAGDTQTGITIHAVNEHYDEGKIIFQASCPVMPDDSAEDIARKVHALEHEHYAAVIERWIMP